MTLDKNGSGIRAGSTGPDPYRGACARIVWRGRGRYGCAPACGAPAAGAPPATVVPFPAAGTCK
jgi:hypothetical protein